MLQPSLLPLELRYAISTCAGYKLVPRTITTTFSTYAPLLKRKGTPAKATIYPNELGKNGPATPSARGEPEVGPQSTTLERRRLPSKSTELVHRPDGSSSMDRPRTVGAPMKVLPKAQITPELILTPKERMQLEFLTRTPPKRQVQHGYKERLLIYHGGLAPWRHIIIGKVATMVAMFTTLSIIAPAYYVHGSPLIDVAAILCCGTAPFILFYYCSRPFVTWIYLPLPAFARKSPMAALRYAQNLPDTATLNLNFVRSSSLPGNVDVTLADLHPLKQTWLAKSFEWTGRRVDTGPWYRPNPTKFWVRKQSGKGKESRDVVPGIWEHVYRRIMKIESEDSSKWKR